MNSWHFYSVKRGSCFQCTYILKALGDHLKVVKKISTKDITPLTHFINP